MKIVPDWKTCCSCKLSKRASMFNKDKRKGLKSECKECSKKRNKLWREAARGAGVREGSDSEAPILPTRRSPPQRCERCGQPLRASERGSSGHVILSEMG